MTVTVVDALIRQPNQMGTNGIQCDQCGVQVNCYRSEWPELKARLIAEGWHVPTNKVDPAYCPEHNQPCDST